VLRSMFSAVSGLRSHQTMMDVTGNNVANVNTTGYKTSRATFQETLTQVVRGGTVAGAANGGVNPMQLGLGAKVASTDTTFSQGASQLTGRSTDLSIQGEGFFVVNANGEELYTRAGAFSIDGNGNLVGPGGEYVQGWTQPGGAYGNLEVVRLDGNGQPMHNDIAVGADGVITGRTPAGAREVLGQVAMASFANENGLERRGNGLYGVDVNSGPAQIGAPGTDGRGTIQSGTLEMSNVDLAQEFTNLILAQRGFQANARTITSSDEMLQELVNLKR
jgi:flagellar hook protein FlgE